jgi:hypothetical protein
MKTALTTIIILLALIFIQRECNRPDPAPPEPDTIRITKVEYDSVLVEKIIKQFYPVQKIVVREIPANVDTMAILKDYFAKNIYDRTFIDDTTALIRVIDTVHQNQLWGSRIEYKNRQPVTIHETYIIHPPPPQRFQLYAGGFVTGNAQSFGAGPAIFAKTPRDHLYGIGYNPFNNTGQIHMLWKISLRTSNQ